MSSFHVVSPFKIPIEIDDAYSTESATLAVWQAYKFLVSMLVADRGFAFWAITLACACCVVLMLLVGTFLLCMNTIKGEVTLFVWRSFFDGKMHLYTPTLAAIISANVFVAGLSFVLLCIHRFRLDQLLHVDELNTTLIWFSVIWISIWLALYFETIALLSKVCSTPSQACIAPPSALRRASNWTKNFVILVLCPIAVTLSVAIPSFFAQHFFFGKATPFFLFLEQITTLLKYWEAVTPVNSLSVLRKVEADAIPLWKLIASAYNRLQPIYILWSIYFGLLSLFWLIAPLYAIVAAKIKTKKAQVKPTTISDDMEELKASTRLILDESVEKPGDLPIIFKATSASVAVLSTMIFAFLVYVTVRLPHASVFAQTPGLLGKVMCALGVVQIAGGALCITILSVKLNQAFHKARINQAIAILQTPHTLRRHSSISTTSSDATLT